MGDTGHSETQTFWDTEGGSRMPPVGPQPMNCHYSHALSLTRPSAPLSLAGTYIPCIVTRPVSSDSSVHRRGDGKSITLPLLGARLALRKSGLRFAVD